MQSVARPWWIARPKAATIVAAAALAGCQPQGSGRFLSIGTGGTGGIYYPLGGALASRLSLADSTRQYTAEVTGGSLENVNRVAAGEMDLGFTLASTAVEAFAGAPDQEGGARGLRMVAPLYPNVTHVLVRSGSDITSVADVAGRRVSVGAAGSGTEQVARQLLDAYGLTYDDVDARYLSFRESSDALRDGAVEAAIFSVGYPAAAVLEALTSRAAELIAIDAEHIQILSDRHSYYRPAMIPEGAYPGVDADLSTTALLNWIVGSESLDDTVVRLLLTTLDSDRASLERVHRIASQIDLGVLAETPLMPLHPETARWAGSRQ